MVHVQPIIGRGGPYVSGWIGVPVVVVSWFQTSRREAYCMPHLLPGNSVWLSE